MSGYVLTPKLPAPHIWSGGLPEEERQIGEHIDFLLSTLSDFSWRYDVALELSRHSQERARDLTPAAHEHRPHSEPWVMARTTRQVASDWNSIALRESAFVLYHFEITLDSICTGIKQTSKLLSFVNTSDLYKAKPLFRKRFPEPIRVRNAIGHEADLQRTAEKKRKHMYKKQFPGGGSISINSLQIGPGITTGWERKNQLPHTGMEIHHSIEGSMVFAELSPEGAQLIHSVVQTVFSAFREASDATRNLFPLPPGVSRP